MTNDDIGVKLAKPAVSANAGDQIGSVVGLVD